MPKRYVATTLGPREARCRSSGIRVIDADASISPAIANGLRLIPVLHRQGERLSYSGALTLLSMRQFGGMSNRCAPFTGSPCSPRVHSYCWIGEAASVPQGTSRHLPVLEFSKPR